MSWKFLTPYSLCVFAPLRDINHPAIMQRQIAVVNQIRQVLIAESLDHKFV
ncbi:hypothetical protein [Nostoc sp. FACHB-280]|uniref:hypothetical protein n=1 Tax=Nostoc sp. FACHB-280 TaxID=2692839 RepID=UPI00168B6536|nr:hypothetical protein [Nostoc sp. FACHB-280]MBD2493965.1 hypothetical protein [Nostoc sp. FACHB-280]